MITLRDLSQQLGVSTATISNALTGKGRMRPEKRQEILETAIAMGYDIRNAQIRHRVKTIYLLVEQMNIYFLTNIIDSFCEAAEDAEANVLIYDLNLIPKFKTIAPDNFRVRDIVRPVLNRIAGSASGIVYLSQYTRDLSGILPKTPIPTIVVYGYTNEGRTSINYDDASGAYLATEHLIHLGYRKIAMISGPIDSIPMTKRLAGYQRALIDGGLSFDPRLIQLGDWKVASSYASARQLLSLEEPPDALFCQNDTMAVGAMRALNDLGLRVGHDVGIVGFDNESMCDYITPTLTSIAPPFEDMGRKAFEILWNMMGTSNATPESVKLPCRLVVRESSQMIG